MIIKKIDEALPYDLARAYKNARIDDQSGYANIGTKGQEHVDFNKSTYTKIDKEQARKLYSKSPEKLHVIFAGQLVSFDHSGQIKTNAYSSKAEDASAFSGAYSTEEMSIKEVLDRADSLYEVDEVYPDYDTAYERRQNPESSLYNGDFDAVPNSQKPRHSTTDASKSERYYVNKIKSYQADLKNLKDELANSQDDEFTAMTRFQIKDIEQEIARNQENLAELRRKTKNSRALLRNYTANAEMHKPIIQYQELQRTINSTARRVERQTQKIQDIKDNGSLYSRHWREKLESYEDDLKAILQSIEACKARLEHVDEEDADEIAKVSGLLDKNKAELKDATEKISRLMATGRYQESFRESIEDYYPAEDVKDVYLEIEDAGNTESFKDLLSAMYDEDLTDGQIDDILRYESDYILDTLGGKHED